MFQNKDLELKEWHALACDLVSEGEISPKVVSTRVQQLEQAHLVLKNDLSEAMSQLRLKEDSCNKMERELRAEKERYANLHNNHAAQTSRMQKMDRKLQLITKVCLHFDVFNVLLLLKYSKKLNFVNFNYMK